MIRFPDAAAWRKACAHDATLHAWAGAWSVCFAVTSGSDTTVFNVVDGKVQQHEGRTPAFTLAAPVEIWARFLQEIPPRHHQGIFAMHYRVPDFSIQGDQLAFMQH